MQQYVLEGEQATLDLGAALAANVESGSVVCLHGDLGAGKTTLVRGFLRSLGYEGPVKSPTYTLVEPYDIAGRQIYHFDLYRLADPEELEYMGIRDFLDRRATSLIEWPEQGEGVLPQADIELWLQHDGMRRLVSVRGISAEALGLAETGC